MYGRHPYAVQTPEPEQVKGVRPAQLRALHADRVRPDGAVLVLVGDLNPEKAIDAAEKALGGWIGPSRDGNVPPTPELEPGPLLLVDRPGSVQSSLRMALPAVARTDPDYARAAAGQPGLRRLLLVALGGEHPRGQGLHVRPAQLDRALRRRLRAGGGGRGGHRGDRPGAAGDPVRAGPHRQPAAGRGGARAGPPVRPGHPAPGHVHPGRARRAGQHVRELRPAPGLPARALGGAGRGDPRAGRRGGGPLPGAVAGGHRGARRRRQGRGAAGRADRGGTRAQRRDRRRTQAGRPAARADRARAARADGPPLARTHAWTGPRTTGATTTGWPRPGSAACVLVIDIAKGGRALVTRAPGRQRRRWCSSAPTTAPGRRAAVPRRRPGRHCRSSRWTPPLPAVDGRRAGDPARRRAPARRPRTPGIFTTAAALANWHASHRFSPRTGQPTTVIEAGWSRVDADGQADVAAYRPGDDRAGARRRRRTGRAAACSATTPRGPSPGGVRRFSCLAGYVEPGESAEAAVVREVARGGRRPAARPCGTRAASRGRTRVR